MSWFRSKKSAASAKERLQLVLIHDRTDLTPAELNELKDELIQVISRHVEIDPDAVQIECGKPEVRSLGHRLIFLLSERSRRASATRWPVHGVIARRHQIRLPRELSYGRLVEGRSDCFPCRGRF